MGWESILQEDDYRFYRENISLLEDQVLNRFSHARSSSDILSAIRKVPRHLFVHPGYKKLAYTDNALPTFNGLTTSAPSVIAEMIYLSGIREHEKLLEIGTGTGYEAAVLSEMGVAVFSIEIDSYVARQANSVLTELGYKTDSTVHNKAKRTAMIERYSAIKHMFPRRGSLSLYNGSGYNGLPEEAPFHAIIMAASVPQLHHIRHIPKQLKNDRGRLIVPVGRKHDQVLHLIERAQDRFTVGTLDAVSFDFVRLVSTH